MVQAAEARDALMAGIEEQVEGVAEHQVVPELAHLPGRPAIPGAAAGPRRRCLAAGRRRS